MNIHEYQAKEIFRRYGIPIPEGSPARTSQDAYQIARQKAFWDGVYVVKAQVHAGGRGKGGGIKILKTPEDVKKTASILLGSRLVTPQTDRRGLPVDSVLVEFSHRLSKEYYAGVILDRAAAQPCLILSEAGGMDIEQISQTAPEKIHRFYFDPETGITEKEAVSMAESFEERRTDQIQSFARIFQALSKIFIDYDCTLVEINPLAFTATGELLAIDGKIHFDDNALYRHTDLEKLRDPHQADPRETEAKKYDLSYVGLEGDIGCIVNGAGLAMATMDILKYAGGEPANFLDVGGGATKEKVAAAFQIILRDPKVKAVLVNIFGGIMRCDIVAEGILQAVREIGVQVPIVVRMEGTNVQEAKVLLNQSELKVITAATFSEAAEKAVQAAAGHLR